MQAIVFTAELLIPGRDNSFKVIPAQAGNTEYSLSNHGKEDPQAAFPNRYDRECCLGRG